MSAAVEFDEFSDDYSERLDQCVRVSGQDSEYFAVVKAAALVAEMEAFGLVPAESTVLDFGCGTGSNSVHLADSVGTLLGTDVSGASLPPASERVPAASFVHTEDLALPLRDNSVDVALISCVLHHILPSRRNAVMAEINRVLQPNGFVFIVEHNPFNPATRWIVNRCEFDEDAILLTPKATKTMLASNDFDLLRLNHILFVPGRGRIIDSINGALRRVPFGAQYTVSARPRSA